MKNSQKKQQYVIWILLLVSITLLNFWQITKNGCKKENLRCREVNERRITSLFVSNTILQRKVKETLGYNIVTNKEISNLIKDTTLVILLSDFKCGKCQENELKRLNLLSKKELINIDVIGITTRAKRNQVAIQQKILKLDFPIYWVDDEIFFNKLAFAKEFPQVLYVANGIVQSAFKPLTKDDKFSEDYYNSLLKKTNNNLPDEAKQLNIN